MRKKGFTLIELLVVIAIIAILAAILFPVFVKVKENARQAACSSNLKQLSVAALMYWQDYGDRFPHVAQPYTPISWYSTVYSTLTPYTKNLGIQLCPSGPRRAGYSWDGNPQLTPTYFWNAVLSNVNYYGLWKRDIPRCFAEVRYPTKTIMIGDSLIYFTLMWPPSRTDIKRAWRWGGSDGAGWTTGLDNARHNDGYNFAFVDGHVKWFKRGTTELDSTSDIWWDLK